MRGFLSEIVTFIVIVTYMMRVIKGTKRLVSVQICSVKDNSAGIFVSKVPPGIFVIKKRRMLIISGRIKLPFWGAIKAQLPFSEGKYQLLNS